MHFYDEDDDRRKGMARRTTIQAVPSFDGVNLLPQGSRAGNADRNRAIEHIRDMTERGYLDPVEGDRRIAHCAQAEKASALSELTSDLPPYKAKRHFDWNDPRHFVPTLITGMMASLILAIVPASALNAAHEFPQTALGIGVAVPSLIIGILGAFACLIGLISKVVE